jgi:nucleoid DNA-binding protein
MNHRAVIRQAAVRFPDLTQRQVEDVLNVLVELWSAALAQGDEIVIRDFGRLTVDVQRLKNSGAVRAQMGTHAPQQLTRLYFRFHPVGSLRRRIEGHLKERA